MEFTDLPRLAPSARAVALCATLFPRRAGAQGSVRLSEAEVLVTLVEMLDARHVVEIGVASGASSLYMLGMLKELGPNRQLFAFDSAEKYYGDESKLSGYLALESEFNSDRRLVLRGGAWSFDVRSTIETQAIDPGAPVDLAFIDANHRHPWPTVDFLCLLPQMREGGVIAFHDINLPNLTGTAQAFGPMRLFSCPFETRFIVGGDKPNLGCIRITDKAVMFDQALASLAKPWEVKFGDMMRERIMAELRGGSLASRADEIAPYFPG